MNIYLCLAIVFITISPAWSYSEGAPNDQETCKTLFPGHFVDPQATPTPYTIEVSKTNVHSKETITLTLKGKTESDTFKGFMIQARHNDLPVGRFDNVQGHDLIQFRTCRTEKDTASHVRVRGAGLNEISFTWTAPEDVKGPVNIVGTIVKNRPTFWVADTYAELTVE